MRFSIIIPLYNKAPYIEKALQSVLDQTFSDYEIVVVDDGSQDGSMEIANLFLLNSNAHYQLIRQDNSGVSVARNNGVACSQGRLLCFLDADDWWAPTFLEEMARLVDDFPDAGIYGTNYTIVNETRHKTRVAPIGVEPGFERGYIDYCQVYAKTLAMPLWTGAVCIPRSFFTEMQGFPRGIKLGEDFLLWIRVALKYKVVFLNKALAYYNQDSDTQWRAIGHLQEPRFHMLWNLGELAEVETSNSDYKLLIDNLRTYGLFPYYLTQQYREIARRELDKVDWSRQSGHTKDLYQKPVWFLRIRQVFLRVGSLVKQMLLKYCR